MQIKGPEIFPHFKLFKSQSDDPITSQDAARLIWNNIILQIISRLSKVASDTRFDILPQFTYTYTFNLPQTAHFPA